MAELTLHSRRVETVFDLLGQKEDDITYSVGWALAQSEPFAQALLRAAYGKRAKQGDITAVLLQESETGTGRTDIEVQSEQLRLVIEAKRGWNLPTRRQLQQYVNRLNGDDSRLGRIAVVSECAPHYPAVAELPRELDGIEVTYLPWSRIAELVAQTATSTGRHAEKRLLLELHRYLRGLMTMQNETSNMVYVVVLNDYALDWCDISFMDIVCQRNRYFHPVGLRGWPKTPPNYMAFRYWGALQRIHHVDSYEVIISPHDHIPEIHAGHDWSDEPHFLYKLGPLIEPPHEVRTGKVYANGRVWSALDLLLTSKTIAQARDRTRARHEAAGIPYP